MSLRLTVQILAAGVAVSAAAAPPPVFDPATRAVSTWRAEAADHLDVSPERAAALRRGSSPPAVARCVKLNNYWCIKSAGWDGELASDGEGHVAFASAVDGAAVAAILLKRYYVDFGRKTAAAIVSHWAPAFCGGLVAARTPAAARLAPKGLAATLRGRWLASHARGFASPVPGRRSRVHKSVVADRAVRPMAAPAIAVGLGEAHRPMTLDALLMSSPNAPPSRSMLGMPRAGTRVTRRVRSGNPAPGSIETCGSDGARVAAYAAKAAQGLATAPDGDLGLFAADGTPTPALATLMANMARVEIWPDAATPALVEAGIAAAFRPGRNDKESAK